MTMETGANILWFAMAFTLVLSALVVRRLPAADWIKMGLAWVAIFALVFLAIRTYQLAAG
ncbi:MULTISPECIES: hypothetical protein [Sphingopyxis]|jgi:hypothetical protein|uniref:Membrane protein n=1 Tax=Sphingopyxis granuli TaxID=267128 RepID=A0AA86GM22_9SPHN|nr:MULTISPECIES: hypothetical protein [Sphingopyxis]AMG74581.1 Putative membrane protein [Sphingopyxis granuli]APW72735.1 hypothetical protein BWD40_07670 [Sphingopyxis granuli]ODU29141.1 MAG: hypothetical protein ABS88_09245 [Sphingopyxis sp. SCN 67-31]QUM74378.1 hypothetical protein ICN83_12525 [Sphingopyxis granuli]UNK78406.1 hypothetical protein MNQ96_12580 [Sphingopyxis granuli]